MLKELCIQFRNDTIRYVGKLSDEIDLGKCEDLLRLLEFEIIEGVYIKEQEIEEQKSVEDKLDCEDIKVLFQRLSELEEYGSLYQIVVEAKRRELGYRFSYSVCQYKRETMGDINWKDLIANGKWEKSKRTEIFEKRSSLMTKTEFKEEFSEKLLDIESYLKEESIEFKNRLGLDENWKSIQEILKENQEDKEEMIDLDDYLEGDEYSEKDHCKKQDKERNNKAIQERKGSSGKKTLDNSKEKLEEKGISEEVTDLLDNEDLLDRDEWTESEEMLGSEEEEISLGIDVDFLNELDSF